GRGSTFTVRLPRLAQAPPAPETPTPAGVRAPRRILVVDDNADAAHSMGMLLELSGHTVAYALDGLQALRTAAQLRPDVILLDLGLPGMDGYAVAARLRSDPAMAHAALIALTGYGQQEDKARTLAAGFDHHLVKPIDQAQLDAVLAHLPMEAASPVEMTSGNARAGVTGTRCSVSNRNASPAQPWWRSCAAALLGESLRRTLAGGRAPRRVRVIRSRRY